MIVRWFLERDGLEVRDDVPGLDHRRTAEGRWPRPRWIARRGCQFVGSGQADPLMTGIGPPEPAEWRESLGRGQGASATRAGGVLTES